MTTADSFAQHPPRTSPLKDALEAHGLRVVEQQDGWLRLGGTREALGWVAHHPSVLQATLRKVDLTSGEYGLVRVGKDDDIHYWLMPIRISAS